MNISAPCRARLKELLSYDPTTGEFIRNMSRGGMPKGSIAGNIDSVNGYIRIGLDWTSYKAHRLAWLYMTGDWPEEAIDHKNGDRSDNRFTNLRLATIAENNQNVHKARRDCKSGYRGVSWFKSRQKWRAAITHEGRQRHLGYFDSAQDAHSAYLAAKSKLHQFSNILGDIRS